MMMHPRPLYCGLMRSTLSVASRSRFAWRENMDRQPLSMMVSLVIWKRIDGNSEPLRSSWD